VTASAIWQEVEFGGYGADLPLWIELADAAGGPVAELGAGAGRVSLHLAGHGHDVIAVERDAELLAELQHAAERHGVALSTVKGDLAAPGELRLPARPTLAVGPLHVIQVLDEDARSPLLASLGRILAPGATVALTLVDESTMLTAGTAASTFGRHTDRGRIYPDMRELDGWVYSSEPLWVQVGDRALAVRRLRERVSPEGRMEREVHDEILFRVSPDALEQEAAEAGLRPAGRRMISSGPNEADSIVVLLEVPV
jgi:SAM-dependent methyltransferase